MRLGFQSLGSLLPPPPQKRVAREIMVVCVSLAPGMPGKMLLAVRPVFCNSCHVFGISIFDPGSSLCAAALHGGVVEQRCVLFMAHGH